MNSDREIMRYFPNTLTKEKSSAEFIGFLGFHQATFQSDFTPCVEIGWRLKKEAWGKGYATEGAMACLAYGFEVLDFKDVYSFTAKINKPSSSVMEKIGMEYIKSFDYPGLSNASELKEHVLYRKQSK